MVNIAFAGVKLSGKDTAASILINKFGYQKVALADPMKEMMRAYLRYRGVSYDEILRMIEGDLKEIPSPALEGKTPRYFLQRLGTEFGRDLVGQEIWLNSMADRAKYLDPYGETNYVTTDCRFHNECNWFRERGWIVIRVNRPGYPAIGDLHSSETSIPALNASFDVANDGDIEDLQRKVENYLRKMRVLT